MAHVCTSMLRQAAIFVMLLAAHASMASAQNVSDTLQYTEKFLFSKISSEMLHINDNIKAAMSGRLKHQAPTSPQQVGISCL